jgi:carbamoyltransferase
MIHWGINALNHGSSLAIFNKDQLIINITDREDTLPQKAFDYANKNRLWPDRIYWYENPWLKKIRQLQAGQYSTALRIDNLPRSYLKKYSLDKVPITHTPHHASHAAAGYYTSPFNHCAVVVLDAIGEFDCASIWEGKHGELRKVWSAKYPNSIGLFYSAFTDLIDLTPIVEEHILQKYSELGDANRYYNQVSTYLNQFMHFPENLHRGVRTWPYTITTEQDRYDIAAAVQQVFEEQVDMVMLMARKLTGSDCLVYMGGCAMNSKYNKQLLDQWKYVWSLPNPGDPSSSVGAVLYHTKQRVWDYDFGVAKHLEISV